MILISVSVFDKSMLQWLGDDEQSAQMMSSWEDARVTEESNNSFVAIKVDAKRYCS